MKNNLIKYILVFVAIAVIVAVVIIIYLFFDKSENVVSTQQKVEQEIEYLDKKLVSVANSLNNLDTEYLLTNNEIKAKSQSESNAQGNSNSAGNNEKSQGTTNESQSDSNQSETIDIKTINPKSVLTRDRNDIDWQYINIALEEISNSWAIINIDLKSIDVPNDELLTFRDNIDTALKYSKENDKINSLISVANIYSMIPNYENRYSNETMDIELKYIKSDIISSYALLDTDRWSEILGLLNDADSRMSKLVSLSGNSSDIQKIYVELKEYIKSVNDMELDLCYMKYFYLIKDIENKK